MKLLKYLVVVIATVYSFTKAESECSSDRLLLYSVTMETSWSKTDFPKDYPKFRPPAQWSKLIGRSHNSDFSLYHVGSFATVGFKKFAETGSSDIIDTWSQGTTGVCDAFTAPPITEGVGTTETQFFADGNHSMVSLAARIIPSPDWFVGVDSVDLCIRGQDEWVQSLRIEVDACDGGSDNGYTFTAPKWPSVPQEAIYEITPQHPSHPASSFYYPDKIRHRPIATFTFTKLKEYSLWATQQPLEELSDLETNDISQDEEIPMSKKRKRSRRVKGRDCIVSKWAQWSDCTSKTCDMSEQYRTRSILSHPKNNGLPCPPLLEKKMCVPDKGCQPNLFDWE